MDYFNLSVSSFFSYLLLRLSIKIWEGCNVCEADFYFTKCPILAHALYKFVSSEIGNGYE